jgi:hypothetical protein
MPKELARPSATVPAEVLTLFDTYRFHVDFEEAAWRLLLRFTAAGYNVREPYQDQDYGDDPSVWWVEVVVVRENAPYRRGIVKPSDLIPELRDMARSPMMRWYRMGEAWLAVDKYGRPKVNQDGFNVFRAQKELPVQRRPW